MWLIAESAPRDGTPILGAFRYRGDGPDGEVVQVVTRWRSDTIRPGWYIDIISSIQIDHTGVDDDDAADLIAWTRLPDAPEC